MEVRSTEKCGSDAAAAATASTTAKVTSNNKSMESKSSTDVTRAAVNMDLSRTTVKDEQRPPLTRDEKLVAELKSRIPDVDNIFKIHRRIGEGTFSTVFLTSLRCHEHLPNKKLYALKYLIPTSHPRRIVQELRCLKEIGGVNNVVGVDLCLRNKDAIAFVMPYMPHDRFHEYFDKMAVNELREYMENLLIALKRVHEFGVIHRDVKPSNFLHDRRSHKFLLVDFGLAHTLDKDIDSTKSLKSTCKENPSDKTNNKPNEENTECDNKNEQQLASARQSHEASLDNGEAMAAEETATAPSTDQPLGNANESTASKSKRKLSDTDETENKCSNIIDDNPAKRLRPLTDQRSIATGNENTSQHPRGPYIPSSHFKTPLKQMNEISAPKQYKLEIIDIGFQSPLLADIKSTVLTYSIGSKIQSQRGVVGSGGNSLQPKLSTPTQLASAKTAFSKITTQTTTPPPPPPPPPPERKYNVDNRSSGRNVKCYCFDRPTVCTVCLVKKEIQATRAGTPGYRPPEVLLKHPNQTTAVDCWAAGVILISILSGCYPFFNSRDDFNALAEIITVFGDEVVKKTANALGRKVWISHKKRPLHLRKLCLRLRNRKRIQNTPLSDNTLSTNLQQQCVNCQQQLFNCLCQDSDYNTDFSNDIYPDSVYDLLGKLLVINPCNRISAKDALLHPFFHE